jgi:peptidoglycan-associated lipoprotein
MKLAKQIILLGAALAMTACTNPGRFGADGFGGGNRAGGAIEQGNPSDPRSAAYFQQAVGDRVLFLVDQSALTPEAQFALDGQAQWLLANPDYFVKIEGHADEQGTREYNLALGARRANAAREYLVSKGVPAGRMTTVSFGKERPLEVCSNESCYAKNRRAVTVLTTGLSG